MPTTQRRMPEFNVPGHNPYLLSLASPIFPARVLLFTGLLLFVALAHASPPIAPIDSGWSYHWGDIPRSHQADNTERVHWQFSEAEWNQAGSLANVAGRSGEDILWLKLDLPESKWRNPHLLVSYADIIFQVFEAGRVTYEHGRIGPEGKGDFAGWPWHLIPVAAAESTSLYFRIYSSYYLIGLSEEVIIGEKADLLEHVYHKGMTGGVFFIILFIVGIVSMALGLIKGHRRNALSIGFLSLDLSLTMFAQNELSQIVFFSPLILSYIWAFGYFLVPAFMAWVVYEWFDHKISKPVLVILCVSFGSMICAFVLSSITDLLFIEFYPSIDVLFIVSMLALLIECGARHKGRGIEEGLIILGLFIICLSLILDAISFYGIVTWIGQGGQWGLTLFAVSLLTVYLIKDKKQQESLALLTHNLENTVAERTRALNESLARLEELARTDFLTGLLNRRAFMELANREVANSIRHQHPLSLMLFDIDHFKRINDRYGHDTGDRVLTEVAKAVSKTCRESDLICRWGGEEFVVLLQSATPDEAKLLAARTRETIQSLDMKSAAGNTIATTASFGFISYDGYQETSELNKPENADRLLDLLLKKADSAMYHTKNRGRNDVTVHEISSTD